MKNSGHNSTEITYVGHFSRFYRDVPHADNLLLMSNSRMVFFLSRWIPKPFHLERFPAYHIVGYRSCNSASEMIADFNDLLGIRNRTEWARLRSMERGNIERFVEIWRDQKREEMNFLPIYIDIVTSRNEVPEAFKFRHYEIDLTDTQDLTEIVMQPEWT